MYLIRCNILCALLIAAFISDAYSSPNCPVTSDGCATSANFNELSSSNLNDYCTQGPIKVQQAWSCLTQCNFLSSLPAALLQQISAIDNTCGATSGCGNITSRYLQYNQCFTVYDKQNRDLPSILNGIIQSYNSGSNPSNLCNTFRYGRTCQYLNIDKCSYLQLLDTMFFMSNINLDTVLYICGSEDVPKTVDNDNCSPSMMTEIQNQCGESCLLVNSPDVNSFCLNLQSQINCITARSSGCTNALVTYLLPRFDSYAMVNSFLSCNISFQGVVIKPRGILNPCSYESVLQSCFGMNMNLYNRIPFPTVKNLLNFDFTIDGHFCWNNFSRDNQREQCTEAFWSCELPAAKIFSKPAVHDSSFNLGLGTFPLNLWGLETIFSMCSTMSPFNPTAICQPPAVTNARPTPTLTKNRATPTPRPTPRLRNFP